MNRTVKSTLVGCCLVCAGLLGGASAQGDGKKIIPGDLIPPYQLFTRSGEPIEHDAHQGEVRVLIYVIAKQRGSERAIADASKVVKDLKDQPIHLVFVTADTDQADYFAEFWKEKRITPPLAFDPQRTLYADLGLIAFPSTLIIDPDGKLIHALSTHSPNYPYVLEGYIRHALGTLDDAGLSEYLKARQLPTSSPASQAARHRAVARLMREKGLDEAAEKELLSALELDPQSLDVRLDLAELYLHLDRIDEASAYIKQVQRVDAGHRHAMLLEGIVLFRQGNDEQAQAVLTQALKLNPDPARTHYYLGRVAEAQGNKDQALTHYRQALERLLDEPGR